VAAKKPVGRTREGVCLFSFHRRPAMIGEGGRRATTEPLYTEDDSSGCNRVLKSASGGQPQPFSESLIVN
jgi:hypothetical protein